MQRNLIPLFVLAAGLLAAGARAQDDDAPAVKDKRPCKSDIQSLCKGMKGGAIWTCLMQNADKVQDATCKARVQKFKAKDDALKAACSAEVSANCQNMDIGTGLLKCLKKNRKSLSDGCKAQLKAGKGPRGKMKGGAAGGAQQGDAQPAPAGGSSDEQ